MVSPGAARDRRRTRVSGAYCPFIRDPEPMFMAKVVEPLDGDVLVTSAAMLTWTASATAVQHHVYFGEDRAAVEAAVVGSPLRVAQKSKLQTTHDSYAGARQDLLLAHR
jgi:hypothetical protein